MSRPLILVGGALLLVAVVVIAGAIKTGNSDSANDVPDVGLSIGARDTLMMSARFMRDLGRNVDVTAWRYDTPACAVLSDYYGSYLTSPGDRTVDQVNSDFMSNGFVGSSLRNHAKHFGGTEYVP